MFWFNFENINSWWKINKTRIIEQVWEDWYRIVEWICRNSQEKVRKTVDVEMYTLEQKERIKKEQLANSIISEKDNKLQELIKQTKNSNNQSSVWFHTMQQSKPKQKVSRIQWDVNKAVEEQLKLLWTEQKPSQNNNTVSSWTMSQEEIDALIKRMAS